ncbi:MAG: hypothetical protein JNL49_09655 [Bacteroidia bacterium]|nr:hypothetical protein [Bacteroidia bacterium]
MAKSKYNFSQFTESQIADGSILWRHDVDYSPQSALKLAEIESQEGIKSTFFVLFHSEFYNLLEKVNIDCFKNISKLGHEIGLHFDASFFNVQDITSLEKYLNIESTFLGEILNEKIKAFSFHNPFEFELGCNENTYAGLINTYAKRFHKEIGYCSDSNGYWRHKRLEDVLTEGEFRSLQVLTHPEWWQDEILSPKQRVLRCIEGRSENVITNYENFLKLHGRSDIDW